MRPSVFRVLLSCAPLSALVSCSGEALAQAQLPQVEVTAPATPTRSALATGRL